MAKKLALSEKCVRYSTLLLLSGLAVVSFLSFSKQPDGMSSAYSRADRYTKRQIMASESPTGSSVRSEGSPQPVGAQQTSSATHHDTVVQPLRLMLASHNRLFWYHPETGETHVVHEGEGVHYGVFPGRTDPTNQRLLTVWNVIRPHNWHPASTEEHLVELDAETGREMSRVKLDSRFTHDAVRSGEKVFVCNTEGGEVQQLSYPTMRVERKWPLFTLQQHINTLAPLDEDEMWVVMHNMGSSDIVRLELCNCSLGDAQPSINSRIRGVGNSAHGLVSWRGDFIVLDSQRGALVKVDPTGLSGRKDTVIDPPKVLWKAPEGGKFLKGLAIVDDIAYFGISVFSDRAARGDSAKDSELGAFDLETGTLLFRRTVPTKGLLNIVAAPHLGEASTYRAMKHRGHDEAVRHQQHLTTSTLKGSSHRDRRVIGSRDSGSGGAESRRRDLSDTIHSGGQVGKQDGSIIANLRLWTTDLQAQSSRLKSGKLDDSNFEEEASVLTTTPNEGSDSKNQDWVADEEVMVEVVVERLIEIAQAKAPQAAPRSDDDPMVVLTRAKLVEMGYPPAAGGNWPSGLPFLDLAAKSSADPWSTGIQMPLTRIDVTPLQDVLRHLPDYMWDEEKAASSNAKVQGRDSNMNTFKPGCGTIFLVFSDQSTENAYRYPYYKYFSTLLEPILLQLIGEGVLTKIVRMQFARIPAGGHIRIHADQGGFAHRAHRIHVPIVTNGNVSFEICPKLAGRKLGHSASDDDIQPGDCVSAPMIEGVVTEINNIITHRVLNLGSEARIQWVIDVVEEQRSTYRLQPGTRCSYTHGAVICPEGSMEKVL